MKKGQFRGLSDTRPFAATDIRFTTKGNKLYAFCMEKPDGDIRITSLGKSAKLNDKKIAKISLLGSKQKLKWSLEDDALVISKPTTLPDWAVQGFEIELD